MTAANEEDNVISLEQLKTMKIILKKELYFFGFMGLKWTHFLENFGSIFIQISLRDLIVKLYFHDLVLKWG